MEQTESLELVVVMKVTLLQSENTKQARQCWK
jgi:hypothetical protein